jgi:hypothetical protein
MRKQLFVLLNAVSLAGFAQKSEEEDIKKVIQQETISYFHKNYDEWANTWAHDTAAYIVRAGTNGHNELIGWNAIAASYKQDIANMPVLEQSLIEPYLNKTDYHIYINGNTATVTFKEGTTNPSFETRSLIKQNGNWKILNMTLINSSSYAMMQTVNMLRSLVGTWELEPGTFKGTPDDGTDVKTARFEIRETPNGFAQVSTVTYTTTSGSTVVTAPETEYFIPDNNQMEIVYMDIQKNQSGQTYTTLGKLVANKDGSFTVKGMYGEKPTATKFEYTVSLKEGKWHQTSTMYGLDGKQTATFNLYMHRAMSGEMHTF